MAKSKSKAWSALRYPTGRPALDVEKVPSSDYVYTPDGPVPSAEFADQKRAEQEAADADLATAPSLSPDDSDDAPAPPESDTVSDLDPPAPVTFAEYTAAVTAAREPIPAAQQRRAELQVELYRLGRIDVLTVTIADLQRREAVRAELMTVDQTELAAVRALLAIDPTPAVVEARRLAQAADEAVPVATAKVREGLIGLGYALDAGQYPVGSQVPAMLAAVVRVHPSVRAAVLAADHGRQSVRELEPHTAGLAERAQQLEGNIRRAAGIAATA